MKTFMAKKGQEERKWLLVDADGATLGRLAAKVATLLLGKHKVTYTPHADVGDFVVVVNAAKIRVSGRKAETNSYNFYSRYPGNHKYVSYEHMMEKKPEWVIEHAVRKMLPKNTKGQTLLKKLKVFRGPEHDHQAQKPEKIELF